MCFKQSNTSILLSFPIIKASPKPLNKRLKHKDDSSNFTIHLCLKNTGHTEHLHRDVQAPNPLG